MNQLWREFLRFYAKQSNRGAMRTGDGVEAAWVNSLLAVNNGTYLTRPVADAADLRARCREAAADAGPFGLPWIFFVYEPLLPLEVLHQVDELLSAEGFHREGALLEMSAGTLLAPARPLPVVELRRTTDAAEARVALDINVHAYEMPPMLTDSVIEANAYFTNPSQEFGYVAYADGVPVSTASVLVINDWMYVDLVATEPEHRQKGYAEAVMRHALAQASKATGVTKTALDASAMGRPLYEQMGYQQASAWRFYMQT